MGHCAVGRQVPVFSSNTLRSSSLFFEDGDIRFLQNADIY
jgi:hypothetical protein